MKTVQIVLAVALPAVLVLVGLVVMLAGKYMVLIPLGVLP